MIAGRKTDEPVSPIGGLSKQVSRFYAGGDPAPGAERKNRHDFSRGRLDGAGPLRLNPRMRMSSRPGCTAVVATSVRVAHLVLPPLIAAQLVAGCGSSPATGGATGNVVLTDATNYKAQGALMIPEIPTAPGADLQICWSGVMKNLLCHTTDTLDNVAFAKIPNIMMGDVEDRLATGKDITNLVTTYGQLAIPQTTGNCAMLSSLVSYTSTANPMVVPATDYTESTTTQYLALITHGDVMGAGAQAMAFLRPTAGNTTMTVNIPDACSSKILTFTPTLGTPVSLPVNGDWKVDWSQLTKDPFQNTLSFSHTKVDKVEVGFYQGKQPSDLQANFLDLDQPSFYTALYSVAVPSGLKWVDLKNAKDSAGNALTFAQTDGTWAVAVLCSTCSVPAPVALSTISLK